MKPRYQAVGQNRVRVTAERRTFPMANRELRDAWLRAQTGKVSRYRPTSKGGR
jgi:hypothetical protein